MNNKNLGQFCSENGVTLLGSDSLIYFDGRWSQESRDSHASVTRERFRKNFPHLHSSMTHYVFDGTIRRVY
jgi:hypothetical protein